MLTMLYRNYELSQPDSHGFMYQKSFYMLYFQEVETLANSSPHTLRQVHHRMNLPDEDMKQTPSNQEPDVYEEILPFLIPQLI